MLRPTRARAIAPAAPGAGIAPMSTSPEEDFQLLNNAAEGDFQPIMQQMMQKYGSMNKMFEAWGQHRQSQQAPNAQAMPATQPPMPQQMAGLPQMVEQGKQLGGLLSDAYSQITANPQADPGLPRPRPMPTGPVMPQGRPPVNAQGLLAMVPGLQNPSTGVPPQPQRMNRFLNPDGSLRRDSKNFDQRQFPSVQQSAMELNNWWKGLFDL